jgi:hypothetical protein
MIDTNVDLRNQREVIVGIDGKNREINRQIGKTDVIVKQMTKKEFCQKTGIVLVIGLLGIVDLVVLLHRLAIL